MFHTPPFLIQRPLASRSLMLSVFQKPKKWPCLGIIQRTGTHITTESYSCWVRAEAGILNPFHMLLSHSNPAFAGSSRVGYSSFMTTVMPRTHVLTPTYIQGSRYPWRKIAAAAHEGSSPYQTIPPKALN